MITFIVFTLKTYVRAYDSCVTKDRCCGIVNIHRKHITVYNLLIFLVF